jgi:hypothetical protein
MAIRRLWKSVLAGPLAERVWDNGWTAHFWGMTYADGLNAFLQRWALTARLGSYASQRLSLL